jgi:DNA polymerase-3 subunit beta
MIFESKMDIFEKAVNTGGKIASKNTTLPVLSSIILSFSKKGCELKATNLDIGIEIFIPGKCDEEKIVAVPSDIMNSFISKIRKYNGIFTIEVNENNNLVIKAGKTKSVIKTVPHDDFPTIPTVEDGKKLKNIDPVVFSNGLKSVWYSASQSTIKPELSSVYMHKVQNDIFFAATDSFRLAEKSIKIEDDSDFPDLLIPAKNIAHIISILQTREENIEIKANKSLLEINTGSIRIASRLVDGVFPDYKQIIPKNVSTEITILKQDLVDALSVSNVFSDKFNQMKIIIEPNDKMIQVDTKNADIGENSTKIDADVVGEAISINFNQRYITDSLQSFDSDSIVLYVSGAQRPMIIKPVSKNVDFMYLVMPMNRS